MVTNFPHFIPSVRATTEEVPTDGLSVIDRLRKVFCGMHGHDSMLQFEQDRMFLRCASCGHETPGWSLDEAPPTVTMRGDDRRLRLPQSQTIGDRRIA